MRNYRQTNGNVIYILFSGTRGESKRYAFKEDGNYKDLMIENMDDLSGCKNHLNELANEGRAYHYIPEGFSGDGNYSDDGDDDDDTTTTTTTTTIEQSVNCPVYKSMIDGWPDAFFCLKPSDNQVSRVYYISKVGKLVEYHSAWNIETKSIKFNKNKTYNSTDDGNNAGDCINKTIDENIAEGRAIYFNPTRMPLNGTSVLDGRPDAITCGNGVMFYAITLSTTSFSLYYSKDGLNSYVKFNGDAKGTF
jgi:hypothetical protein